MSAALPKEIQGGAYLLFAYFVCRCRRRRVALISVSPKSAQPWNCFGQRFQSNFRTISGSPKTISKQFQNRPKQFQDRPKQFQNNFRIAQNNFRIAQNNLGVALNFF